MALNKVLFQSNSNWQQTTSWTTLVMRWFCQRSRKMSSILTKLTKDFSSSITDSTTTLIIQSSRKVWLKNLQTLVCHFLTWGNCTSRLDHDVSLLCSVANPPSTSKGKSPRGTKCYITLSKIINFLPSFLLPSFLEMKNGCRVSLTSRCR